LWASCGSANEAGFAVATRMKNQTHRMIVDVINSRQTLVERTWAALARIAVQIAFAGSRAMLGREIIAGQHL
jgi:hypothetical protein